MSAATAAVLLLAPACGRESEPRPSQPVVLVVPSASPPRTPAPATLRPRPTHAQETVLPASGDSVRASAVKTHIRAVFGKHGDEAVRVAYCESRFDPKAATGSHAGIFQLSRRWHEARAKHLGFAWNRMFEVKPNVAVAKNLFDEKGWQPWTCARITGIV